MLKDRSWVAVLLLLLASCGNGAEEPPLAPGCNPLGGGPGEDCLLPFPSSYYTRADPTTATGLRVALQKSALPTSRLGVALDPTPFAAQDGFSPAAVLLAYFPGPIDPTSLPGLDQPERSLDPAATVQLRRFSDGQPVPLFAELDQNTVPPPAGRQALILHPLVRLQPATRYVALIRGLRTPDGARVPPLSGFAALRDGRLQPGSPRAALKPGLDQLLAFARDRAAVDPADLQVAWDFTTSSDEAIIGRMVRMRDQARAYQPPGQPAPPPITVDQVSERPAALLLREIRGSFTVPSFLTDESITGRLRLDADGRPAIRDYAQFPLTIHVPECAATAPGPLPVMIFGHGSYATAYNEMSEDYQHEISQKLCMIEIGTDWIGRADPDRGFLLQVMSNLNLYPVTTDRLQQAIINVATLAYLVRRGALAQLPALQIGGRSIVDSQTVYYYGISEGGFHGGTVLALTPELERACLNVPWGFWSRYLFRSSDFLIPGPLLEGAYPDPLDRQVLLALTQPLSDYFDPATYAGHVLSNPLPGNAPKRLLYQEGINDASVPNLMTREMVRAFGLPLLSPPIESVYGVREARGPLDSAYVQYDIGLRPRVGATNVPPPHNPVHEAIRRLPAAREQLQRFLRPGGQVEDTCGGAPCLFPQ